MKLLVIFSALIVPLALVHAAPQMAGSRVKANLDDPTVMQAAEYATQRIQMAANSIEPFTLKRIVAAESQVCALNNTLFF